MAPKRKAPISKSAASQSKSNASGAKPAARPPTKKARVEVEYETTSTGASSKGKGKGPAPLVKGAGTAPTSAVRQDSKQAGALKNKKSSEKLQQQPQQVANASSSAAPKKTKADKKKAAQANKKKVAFPDDANNDFAQPHSIASNAGSNQPSLLERHPAPPPTSELTSSSLPTPIAPSHPKAFQIIAGSYEKLLYGLVGNFPSLETIQNKGEAEHDWDLKPVFIFPAHQACVKAVAASEGGKWLATGSTDEIVKIWDLRKRKEVGGLIQHSGSITSLVFPTRSHLLTASEDATLSLFRTRDWTLLRSFKGHTGRINSIAVHPTGKVALTVGHDKTLRMWDLMKGKAAGSTKIYKEGEMIRFSPSGTHLAVLCGSRIELYTVDMRPMAAFENPKRFHDFHFLTLPGSEETGTKDRELLFASTEEGQVRVWEKVEGAEKKEKEKVVSESDDESDDEEEDEEDWREIARFGGHTNRIKSFSILNPLLSTISTDGFVNLYSLSTLPPSPVALAPIPEASSLPVILPVANYDTKGTRLTCVDMTVLAEPGMGSEAGSEFGGHEPEIEDDDDDDDDEGSDGEGGEWGGVSEDGEEGSEDEGSSEGDDDVEEDEMEGEDEDEDEGEYE